MKTARIFFGGAVHEATEAPGQPDHLRLADGRVVPETAVMWLAPFEPRTIFALALNYADHAQELAAKSSAEQGGFLQAQRIGFSNDLFPPRRHPERGRTGAERSARSA